MALEQDVESHYGRPNLRDRVVASLQRAGKDLDRLTLDDLAPIDEFHVRGLEATLELGRGLALARGMHVLDVGSGLGGPARRLASVHGCTITGIDLTAEYCEVATFLTERTGLADLVRYRQGSALAMPFPAATFDAGFTQHVAMNIADKPALYREIARVLKAGAPFGIYDLLRGEGGDVLFPVPWAKSPETSFLATPGEMKQLLDEAGFTVVDWQDTTEAGREWFARLRERIARFGAPTLSFDVLLGDDFRRMAENQVRNLMERRIAPTQIICRKR